MIVSILTVLCLFGVMPDMATVRSFYKPVRVNKMYYHKENNVYLNTLADYLTYAYMCDVIKHSPEMRLEIEKAFLRVFDHVFDWDLFMQKHKRQSFFVLMTPEYVKLFLENKFDGIYYSSGLIYVNGINPDRDETLFHEFLHAYFNEVRIYVSTEEQFVCNMTSIYEKASKKFYKKFF